jgi:hypothetical protein
MAIYPKSPISLNRLARKETYLPDEDLRCTSYTSRYEFDGHVVMLLRRGFGVGVKGCHLGHSGKVQR